MGDYGAAVSQKGYDVKTCADRFLVYSSAFQTLKVFSVSSSSTTVPGEYEGPNKITITHNLGYYAPFLVIYNGSTSIGQTISYYNGVDSTNTAVYEVRMYVDKLEIKIPDAFENWSSGDTVYFTVYIFLDDFSTISEKNINTSISSGSSGNDYGFRISKAGYDVKTCDNINCVMSSSFFTHIIHKKGSSASSGGAVTVSHNLGYTPAAFGFVKDDGLNYIYTVTPSISSNNIVSPNLYSGDVFYYIIFKNRNG
jgi:hypothetical protein